jgi:hypothetical protein
MIQHTPVPSNHSFDFGAVSFSPQAKANRQKASEVEARQFFGW